MKTFKNGYGARWFFLKPPYFANTIRAGKLAALLNAFNIKSPPYNDGLVVGLAKNLGIKFWTGYQQVTRQPAKPVKPLPRRAMNDQYASGVKAGTQLVLTGVLDVARAAGNKDDYYRGMVIGIRRTQAAGQVPPHKAGYFYVPR